jgi:hypothetical protein
LFSRGNWILGTAEEEFWHGAPGFMAHFKIPHMARDIEFHLIGVS